MSTLSFLLAILSGGFNGAYTYHLKSSKNIHLSWLVFGVITFFSIPSILLISAYITNNFLLGYKSTAICLLVGIAFGVGMYLFSQSVKHIGIGIPFALNISLGTISGGLFSVIIHKNFTLIDHFTLGAYICFIVAILLCSYSLSLREKNKNNQFLVKGLIFALFSGILCSFQGATISFYGDEILKFNHHILALSVPWFLIFISCSFIFNTSHFINYKKTKVSQYDTKNKKSYLSGIKMSVFYIFSILIYNFANRFSDSFNSRYIWILFMATIILSSSIISYFNLEWKSKNVYCIYLNAVSIVLVLISIICIGISSFGY